MLESQKNYLRKVAIKTLLFMVILSIIILLIGAVFLPSYMSDVTAKMGMNKLSTSLAVMAYNASEDINDLSDVVEKSDKSNSYKTLQKYSEILQKHVNYDEYVQFLNDNSNIGIDMDGVFKGNLAVSIYENEGMDNAILYLKEVNSESYQNNNTTYWLILHLEENVKEVSISDAIKFESMLDEFYNKFSSDKNSQFSISLNGYSFAKTNLEQSTAEKWEERYNEALK